MKVSAQLHVHCSTVQSQLENVLIKVDKVNLEEWLIVLQLIDILYTEELPAPPDNDIATITSMSIWKMYADIIILLYNMI